jgi:hypothetical protein
MKRRALTSFIVVLVSLSAWSQDQKSARTQQDRLRAVRTTVDVEALQEAAATGDTRLIAALVDRLKHPPEGEDKESWEAGVRLALARLGVAEHQQWLYCQLYSGERARMYWAGTDAMIYVGGWYAIEAIKTFDSLEDHWAQAKGDVSIDVNLKATPIDWAVFVATNSIPGAPKFDSGTDYPREERSRNYARLMSWISDHESELRKLQPSARGVVFTAKACATAQSKK